MPKYDLTDRQKQLFSAIVDEYVETAHPIGSSQLAFVHGFGLSSATIRNDMAVLEDVGFISQPYTSAGRIPTQQGYQYYVEQFVSEPDLSQKQVDRLEQSVGEGVEATVKHVAKTAADLAKEAVFMSIETEYTFYTGISNVLQQPEFEDRELLLSIGSIVDQIDEIVGRIASHVSPEIEVLIGKNNPFSADLTVILTAYQTKSGKHGIIGLLGPMRMEYKQNIAVVSHVQSLLNTYE